MVFQNTSTNNSKVYVNNRPELHLLFELGSLKVFFAEPPAYIAPKPGQKDIYWFDAKNPHGSGPFDTIHAAMKHFSLITETRRKEEAAGLQLLKAPLPPSSEVIQVDFVNKKKLPPKAD